MMVTRLTPGVTAEKAGQKKGLLWMGTTIRRARSVGEEEARGGEVSDHAEEAASEEEDQID